MSIPLIIIISLVIGFLLGAVLGTKKQPQSSVSEPPAAQNVTEAVPINTQQQEENEALKAKISTLEQTLEQERRHAATYRQDMQAYLKTVNSAVDNLCAAVDNIRHTVTTNPTGFAQSATQTVPQNAGDKDNFAENAPVEESQVIVNKEKEEKEEKTKTQDSSRADKNSVAAVPEKDTDKISAPPVDNFVDNSDLSLRGESPQESIKRHLDQSKHR